MSYRLSFACTFVRVVGATGVAAIAHAEVAGLSLHMAIGVMGARSCTVGILHL